MGGNASKDNTLSALNQIGKDGEFKRTESTLRSWVRVGDEKYPPEANRYHLYISFACPWACRCLSMIYFKGLEDVISVSVTHPTWARTRPKLDEHCGWQFADPDGPPTPGPAGYGSFPNTDCIPDTILGSKFIRDIYDKAGCKGLDKFTVPILYDKKTNTIVNNESSEIIQMLNSEFDEFAKDKDLDMRPGELMGEIEALNEWIYPGINNGVYRCGFARSQEAYERAFNELFGALDRVEEILSRQRYLCGDRFSEADIRLFPTLIRFDPVYVVYFKTNKKFLREYPNIREYVKELYAMEPLKKSANIYHIKTHYFSSHPVLNAYAVVPIGGEEWWTLPHNREEKFPRPPGKDYVGRDLK